MAVLLTTLLSLALCGVPAVAYRDDLGLALHNHLGVEAARAALRTRAGASVNASVGDASVGAGKLDSALERKEGNTRCVCLRKLAKKENVRKDRDPVVFAEGVNLGEKSPCSQVCPNLCNEFLTNMFGPSEAEAVDMAPVPVSLPVRVSHCDEESCTCLNTNSATFNVKKYFSKDWGSLEISDIVDQKEYYDTNAQCYESCSCKGGYSELCVDPWSWRTFLETDRIGDDVVGLTSTQLKQTFKLSGGVDSGGQKFTAELDFALDNDDYGYEIKEEALSFSAEGESTTTYNVQIGLGGGEMSSTWELERRGASFGGKDKGWSLKDKNKETFFTIKETKEGEWKVKQVTGSNKVVKFWVQRGDPDMLADAVFRFYTDLEEKSYQGTLQSKKAGGCTVEVWRGKDAGLILVTSILIAKTNDPPLC